MIAPGSLPGPIEEDIRLLTHRLIQQKAALRVLVERALNDRIDEDWLHEARALLRRIDRPGEAQP